jgi:hypothetical protein
MIFETLYKSALQGELMLIDSGLCHWHLRRDGQITIREIISIKSGQGGLMLANLIAIGHEGGATSIFAKCPADLPANEWYRRRGFMCEGTETTKTGRELKLWRFQL